MLDCGIGVSDGFDELARARRALRLARSERTRKEGRSAPKPLTNRLGFKGRQVALTSASTALAIIAQAIVSACPEMELPRTSDRNRLGSRHCDCPFTGADGLCSSPAPRAGLAMYVLTRANRRSSPRALARASARAGVQEPSRVPRARSGARRLKCRSMASSWVSRLSGRCPRAVQRLLEVR